MHRYIKFLKEFDEQLNTYFEAHRDFVCCKKGCSACCEKGDYPISELELKYLMQGFLNLENDLKIQVQKNFKNMKKGEACPFLIDKQCSVYSHRPIICRVHGLAYLIKDKMVKLPYCTNSKKNYAGCFKDGEFLGQPVERNLDTYNVLKDFEFGEIKNLYDWVLKS